MNNECSEMTFQKINTILESSLLKIYKEEIKDSFKFKIKYSNQKEKEIEVDIDQIQELKDNITEINLLKEEQQDDKINKEILINRFIILIDNINQLIKFFYSIEDGID